MVLANGAMPVLVAATGEVAPIEASAGFYGYAHAATYLLWLGDVVSAEVPGLPGRTMVSIGDLLLIVGVVVILCEAALNQEAFAARE